MPRSLPSPKARSLFSSVSWPRPASSARKPRAGRRGRRARAARLRRRVARGAESISGDPLQVSRKAPTPAARWWSGASPRAPGRRCSSTAMSTWCGRQPAALAQSALRAQAARRLAARRGAGDMKCGFAMVLLAVEALRRGRAAALTGSLVFVSAIERSARATARSRRCAPACSAMRCSCPSDRARPVARRPGCCGGDITVSGRAGHAHEPTRARTRSSPASRWPAGYEHSKTISTAAGQRASRAASSTSHHRGRRLALQRPRGRSARRARGFPPDGLRTPPRALCARR